MEPAIVVRDLRVIRGDTEALRGVSLDVARGSVTGLLGPSGSGKSTLMRSIVGVQLISGGHVNVLGQPAGTRALRQQVGYMTQAVSVYADLSVRENLRYFARVFGSPPENIERAIGTVDLGAHTDQIVMTLSGGEQARVSLAVALLNDPEVLVLDEPTVGLDPVLRKGLWDTFHVLAGSGVTLLVSSHVMDEAGRCDTLVLLREGRVLVTETPAELRASTGVNDLDEAFLHLVQGEQ